MATCPVCYGYVPEGTRYCDLCAVNLKDKRPENEDASKSDDDNFKEIEKNVIEEREKMRQQQLKEMIERKFEPPENPDESIKNALDNAKYGYIVPEIRCWVQALDVEPTNIKALIGMSRAIMFLNTKRGYTLNSYVKSLSNIITFKGKLPETAISYCDKALEIEPENIDALFEKSCALFISGKAEETKQYINKILEIDPNEIDALTLLGDLNAALGDSNETIKTFDKILELDPKNISVWEKKVDHLYRTGNYEQTVLECEKLLKIDPENYYCTNYKKHASEWIDNMKKNKSEWIDGVKQRSA